MVRRLFAEKMKICTKCGKKLPIASFYKCKSGKFGVRGDCGKCCRKWIKSWAKENPFHWKNQFLIYNYGISLEDYNKLFEKQKGCCAICGKHQKSCDKSLHVDHNHKTGQVRGLLCVICNITLGHLENNPILADKIKDYLNEFC